MHTLQQDNTLNFMQNKEQNAGHIVLKSFKSKFTLQSLLLHTWSTNNIYVTNQINRSGNTLLIDSHEIINPVQDRKIKNHTRSSGTSPRFPNFPRHFSQCRDIQQCLRYGWKSGYTLHSSLHSPHSPSFPGKQERMSRGPKIIFLS